MEFSVKSGSPEKQRSACIVVGVFEPRRLSPIAEQLDKISDGYISALLRRGELEGKPGQTLLLHHVPNILSERILLIGCGKERELDERQYKQVIQKTINTLNDTGSMEAVCFLTELHVKGRNNYWKVRQAVETAKETLYSFDQLKTNKSEPRRPLRKMVFNVPTRRELTSGERAIQHGLAIAAGIKAAKDLGNMPPNICNAAYLASQARQLADTYSKNVITRVIGEQQMRELGMNAYLAVGNGSQNESLMSVIEYKGNPAEDARHRAGLRVDRRVHELLEGVGLRLDPQRRRRPQGAHRGVRGRPRHLVRREQRLRQRHVAGHVHARPHQHQRADVLVHHPVQLHGLRGHLHLRRRHEEPLEGHPQGHRAGRPGHRRHLPVLLVRHRRGHPGRPDRPGLRHDLDRKSTRLNSSHIQKSRMPSSA